MQFKNIYTQLLFTIFLSFTFLSLVRVFLYLTYPTYFSDLTTNELLLSFFMGLRIDFAILSLFTSILWLLLLLPIKLTLNKNYRISLGIIFSIIVATIVFFNIADVYYFGYVHRHIVNEMALLSNDLTSFVEMAINLYLTPLLVGIVIFLTIVYIFYKIFSSPLQEQKLESKQWSAILLVIIIAFLGIRGKVSGKSFSIADAFAIKKLSSGNLALSGTYTVYRSAKQKNVNHYKIPPAQAIQTLKDTIKSDKFRFANENYPLMRKMITPTQKNYNVVIVMIESLSAKYLDALSHNDFKVTPTLDKLSQEGQLYTNFYANGQRSQDGITTIYTGITQPVGFEAIGSGLELYGLSYLGSIAKANGYTTLAMQSSKRRSFRVDVVSRLAGFNEYYGAEDIPKTGDEKGKPQFGTWDGDSLRFLSQKLNHIQEPFLTFFFTSATHAPYFLPNKRYALYQHNNKSEAGYLNTLYYVDTQIKEFMQRAKQQTWFDNTVFIFTADHVASSGDAKDAKQIKKSNALLPNFHIPLIIYAPKILKPLQSNILSSHSDIIPSIIDMLGFDTEFTMIGQSLFDTSVSKRFAFVKAGNVIGLGTDDRVLFYNYKDFIGTDANVTQSDKDLLLSIDSAQAYLLKNSKWMKK